MNSNSATPTGNRSHSYCTSPQISVVSVPAVALTSRPILVPASPINVQLPANALQQHNLRTANHNNNKVFRIQSNNMEILNPIVAANRLFNNGVPANSSSSDSSVTGQSLIISVPSRLNSNASFSGQNKHRFNSVASNSSGQNPRNNSTSYLQNVEVRRPLHISGAPPVLTAAEPAVASSSSLNAQNDAVVPAADIKLPNDAVPADPKLQLPCRSIRFGSYRTIPYRTGLVLNQSGVLLTVTVESGEFESADSKSNPTTPTIVGSSGRPKPFAINIAWRHVQLFEYIFKPNMSVIFMTVKDFCSKRIREVFCIKDEHRLNDALPFFGSSSQKPYHNFITVILSDHSKDWKAKIEDFIRIARSNSQDVETEMVPLDFSSANSKLTKSTPPQIFARASSYSVPINVVASASTSSTTPQDVRHSPVISRKRTPNSRQSISTDATETLKRLRSTDPKCSTVIKPIFATLEQHNNNNINNNNNNNNARLRQPPTCTITRYQINHQHVSWVMAPTSTTTHTTTIAIIHPSTIQQHPQIVVNKQQDSSIAATAITDRELFVFPFKSESNDCITVSQYDKTRLDANEFLNDTIIDFYLKYILLRVLTEEQRKKVHVFNSFFWHKLTTKPRNVVESNDRRIRAQQQHRRVRTWTKNVDLFDMDFVVIPINENAHWYLAIICYPGLTEPVFGVPTMTTMTTTTTTTSTTSDPPDNSAADTADPSMPTWLIKDDESPLSSVTTSIDNNLSDVSSVNNNNNDAAECSQITTVSSSPEDATVILDSNTSSASQVASPVVVVVTTPSVKTCALGDVLLEQEEDDEEDREEAEEELKQWAYSDEQQQQSSSSTDDQRHQQQVVLKTPCVIVMDSLQSGTPRYKTVSLLRDYITEEYTCRHKDKPARLFDRSTFKGFYPKVPQQDNYHDCGVYVLQYAENFLVQPPNDLTNNGLKTLQNWFSSEQITAKREEIKRLIDSLEEEYKLIKKPDPVVEADNDDTIMSSS